jgi:hypothetical protein
LLLILELVFLFLSSNGYLFINGNDLFFKMTITFKTDNKNELSTETNDISSKIEESMQEKTKQIDAIPVITANNEQEPKPSGTVNY